MASRTSRHVGPTAVSATRASETMPSPLPLSRAVAVSGAAADGAGTGKWAFFVQLGLQLLDFDLGYEISNPIVPAWEQALHMILPFPLYLVHRSRGDVDSVTLRLSDGGHVENLGLLSLIRRPELWAR